MNAIEERKIKDIPPKVDSNKTLKLINSGNVNYQYFSIIKNLTHEKDEQISAWFNISVKTFRNYKKNDTVLKPSIKEHIIMILSLIKHGRELFGTVDDFMQWLETKNFFFDKKQPSEYLNTISGLKFIDDRLTAMEYGDNV